MKNKAIQHLCHEHSMNESEIYGAYKIFFGTLVSESRLRIINLLRKGKKNVSEMIQTLDMDQTHLSHDLARLRECGFVKVGINGKYRDYSLNEKTIQPLMDLIDKHMSGNCVHILRARQDKEKMKRK